MECQRSCYHPSVAAFDVIIPARDEEPTVAGVVRAARGAAGGGRGIVGGDGSAHPRGGGGGAGAAGGAGGGGRVIVVDDGSSDRTAEEAGRAGATVIRARPAGEPGSKARGLARGGEAPDAAGRGFAR